MSLVSLNQQLTLLSAGKRGRNEGRDVPKNVCTSFHFVEGYFRRMGNLALNGAGELQTQKVIALAVGDTDKLGFQAAN